MHSVYIIQSQKDNSLYTGYSVDFKTRLNLHNSGKVKSTKDKLPWKLIYLESYLSQKGAMQRKKYLKSGWGRRYLKNILKDTLSK